MIAFPEALTKKIIQNIDQALDEGATPIAAFDADGTLWEFDAGESFFQYQIQQDFIPGLRDDAWAYYSRMRSSKPVESLLWLAQVNKGKALSELKAANEAFVQSLEKPPLFESQKTIIDHLFSKGVEVYVVTASVKWAVEGPAKGYGIDEDHVIGVKTKIENGTITDEQDGPVTWREGKVTGLLEATNGKAPFFASGNTEGDLKLLETATHIRLVMASASSDHENFETEQKMVRNAQRNNWYYHSFY